MINSLQDSKSASTILKQQEVWNRAREQEVWNRAREQKLWNRARERADPSPAREQGDLPQTTLLWSRTGVDPVRSLTRAARVRSLTRAVLCVWSVHVLDIPADTARWKTHQRMK
jgi:hypothetical protein